MDIAAEPTNIVGRKSKRTRLSNEPLRCDHIVRRSLKEAFLASKMVILDFFSQELLFLRGEIDNSRLL